MSQKRKPGRPSKFTSAFSRQAAVMCKLGATDEQMAEFFGVTVNSIGNWKKKHPEFLGALKLGKDEADDQVVQSLFQRAKGYSHPDVHISNFQGDITVTPITKHYAPDATSCIFWLKNRRPAEWRERQELTGKDGAPLLPPSTDAEVARRLAFLLVSGAQAEAPKV